MISNIWYLVKILVLLNWIEQKFLLTTRHEYAWNLNIYRWTLSRQSNLVDVIHFKLQVQYISKRTCCNINQLLVYGLLLNKRMSLTYFKVGYWKLFSHYLSTCVKENINIDIYDIYGACLSENRQGVENEKNLLKHEMFFILWHISTICIDLNTFSWTSGKFLFYTNWMKWKYILLMVFYRLYALNKNSWYGYFTRSLVLYVCFVDRYLSFCPFSFGHCVIFPSSI